MKKFSMPMLRIIVTVIAVFLSCKLHETQAKAEGQEKPKSSVKDGEEGKNQKKVNIPKSFKEVLKNADSKVGKGFSNIGYSYYQPYAQPEEDKTLAPYFYVSGGDPEVDRLPLKETSADVLIAGVVAQVRVNQLFTNDGKKPIEAVYVFPASSRAAVHAMRMKIGSRTIEAKIEEREEARQQYEQAKVEGKRASLLEQQRPNVFTMNVANIMPGDNIKVELDYSEFLVPEDAVYEFVYPTVVGPRYGGGADPNKDKWIANPYLPEGQKETYKFDIKVNLETGIPIKDVMSPSHKVAVDFKSPSSAAVRLDQTGGGNKDFILRYRLAGEKIESGVLLYSHQDENFFVVMMEPPLRPSESQIPPREYIFVQDVSGSMYGFPLDTSKALMKKLLSSLRSTDYFNLVLFAGSSYLMSKESLPATEENISKAISILEKQQGGGGTELMDGLRTAYFIPKPADKGVSRTVIVCTDGYVGVESQAFKFIRENLSDANLFAFGIGTGVNRALIEGMARAGMGEPFVVLNAGVAGEEAEKFKKYVQSPVLTGINVKFNGVEVYDVIPEKVPDLMALRPIVIMGKWKGDISKGSITVTGTSGSGNFSKTMDFSKAESSERTKPLRVLWARKWVSLLDDQMAMLPGDKELKEAITALGLQYSILTSFTSFVAVDSEVVNKGGGQTTVNQPLPLPEGVSNYAVGGAMPAPTRSVAMESAAKSAYNIPSGGGSGGVVSGKLKKGSGNMLEDESQEKKVVPAIKMVGFVLEPASAKIDISKKKQIQSLIFTILRKKFENTKVSLTLEITIKFKKDGSFSSVKVSGDKGYGIKQLLESEMKSISAGEGIQSIKMVIDFTTKG